MKTPPLLLRLSWWISFAFCFLGVSFSSRAADAAIYGVLKGESLVQTSTAAPSAEGAAPYFFRGFADGTGDGVFTGGRLTLPIGVSIPLSRSDSGDQLEFADGFVSVAALDSAYPSGSYTVRLDTVHDGSPSAVMVLPTTAMPNDPHVANFTEAQSIDASASFVLRWDAMTGGLATDYIQVQIDDSQGNSVYSSPDPGAVGSLNGLSTSVTIPAGVLTAGKSYSAQIMFARIASMNTTAYPGVMGVVAFIKQTGFTLQTTRVPDILRYGLIQSVAYRQTVSSAPALEAHPYRFEMFVENTGSGTIQSASVQTPSQGSQTLSGWGDGMGFGFQASFDTSALLNGAYPVGNYRFAMTTSHEGTKSLTLALDSKTLPAAPVLNNILATTNVNPGADFTLAWNSPGNLGSNDIIRVEVVDDATGTTVIEAAPGTPTSLNGLATSFNIPAGLLSARKSYTVQVEFWMITTADVLSYPGGTGYVIRRSRTTLPLTTGDSHPVPKLANSVLPSGLAGSAYYCLLRAVDGQPPFQFALAGDSNPLPGGLSLSSAGVLSGTAGSSGTVTLRIRITDSSNNAGVSTATLSVAATPPASAPSLTVSPNAVYPDEKGALDLAMGGLVPGQRVRLNLYPDLNNNGQLDTDERSVPLLQFSLTDGQVRSYAGVRDPNVPGDEDGQADGVIHARLAFLSLPELAQGSRKSFFVVTGDSVPLTASASFEVRPLATSQTISGVVRAGGQPVSAYVALVPVQSSGMITAVATGANGAYSLQAPTGLFSIMAVSSGHLVNFDTSPRVNVLAGQNLTLDIAVTPATRTITGQVLEMGSDAPIAGLQISAENDQVGMSVTMTDSDGRFSLAAVAGGWEIRPSQRQSASLGRVTARELVDTTSGSVSNLVVRLRGADALVYGTLKMAGGAPVPYKVIYAEGDDDSFESEAITDSNGAFSMGVVGGMAWSIGMDSDDLVGVGFLSNWAHLTPASHSAVATNLTLLPPTLHLRGRMVNSQGTGLAGVTLGASGSGLEASTLTDATGQFDLALRAGYWSINVWDDYLNDQGLIWPWMGFDLSNGADRNGVVYVVKDAPRVVSGILRDNWGQPIGGVWVNIYQTGASYNYGTGRETGPDGSFTFHVYDGDWFVGAYCEHLQRLGYDCVADVPVRIAGGNGQVELVANLPALRLFSQSMPSGVVGQSYSAPMVLQGTATGWSVVNGSLPPGLGLGADGRVSGMPTASGQYVFTVRVEGRAGQIDEKSVTLRVNANGSMQPCVTVMSATPAESWRLKFTGLVPGTYYRLMTGGELGQWDAEATSFTATSDSEEVFLGSPVGMNTWFFRLQH